ncbi:MAG: deoxyhypusine synthase family protein [Aigarchaeota archaeon]|nr:deoxyhypusine synthase family protein [Aigarchaeota archaeon]
MVSVQHFRLQKQMTAASLVKAMKKMGLGAGELGRAYDALSAMRRDKNCTKFMGVAGAVIPAGLRNVIAHMAKHRYFDALVLTGAGVTHDLMEGLGERPLLLRGERSDEALLKKGVHRIYDIAVKRSSYAKLESFVKRSLRSIPAGSYGTYRVVEALASALKDRDSIVRQCSLSNIPVYSPGIVDSVLGSQIWARSQGRVEINVLEDMNHIVDKAWSSRRAGALFLGGGVPKHFILLAAHTADRPLSYAVQITMDRPEHGGLSGAKLQEAVSWRKVLPGAKKADLICDASIALPLLVAALEERNNHKP